MDVEAQATSSSTSAKAKTWTAWPAATYTATYLPEIAPAQGWDRKETVDSAMRKAGWAGRVTEELRRTLRVRRYQSRKCEVGWNEYVRWRREKGGVVVVEGVEQLG